MIVKLFNMVDLVIRFLPVRECSARKSQFWTEERRPLGSLRGRRKKGRGRGRGEGRGRKGKGKGLFSGEMTRIAALPFSS